MIAVVDNASGMLSGASSDRDIDDAVGDGRPIIDVDLETGGQSVLFDGERWLAERPRIVLEGSTR